MAYNNGPYIITDGLIVCLDASVMKSYGGGNGTTFNDLSTNNYNGTIYNSPSIDMIKGTISLTSNNDYLEIPHVLQSLTIDFWFNTPNTNNAAIIYAGLDQYNSAAWQWSLFYYGNQLLWRPNGGGGGTNITNFVTINNWYHFVMTRSNGNSSIYINGVFRSTNTANPIPTVTGNIRVGKAGAVYWNGSFGPIKIYDKTLNNTEILQNYNALKGRFGL